MKEIIKKVQKEKKDLETKIKKLDDFIMSSEFDKVDQLHQELLGDQFDAMNLYKRILQSRIIWMNFVTEEPIVNL